eukprot:tig00020902_g15034.t1
MAHSFIPVDAANMLSAIALGFDFLANWSPGASSSSETSTVARASGWGGMGDDGVVRRKALFVEPESDVEDAQGDDEIGLVVRRDVSCVAEDSDADLAPRRNVVYVDSEDDEDVDVAASSRNVVYVNNQDEDDVAPRRNVMFVDPEDEDDSLSPLSGTATRVQMAASPSDDEVGLARRAVYFVDPEHEDSEDPSDEAAPAGPSYLASRHLDYVLDDADRVSDDDATAVCAIGSALAGASGPNGAGLGFDEFVCSGAGSCRLAMAIDSDASDAELGMVGETDEDWMSSAFI